MLKRSSEVNKQRTKRQGNDEKENEKGKKDENLR
jgi:hypothetical protein